MRFFLALLIVLPTLMSSTGCSGPPTEGGGLSLPTFQAPEQWEPEIAETPADSDEEA